MEFKKVMYARCSVREYLDRNIEAEKLESVLLAASMAPVGMGFYENIHITVITNRDLLEKVDRTAAEKIGKALGKEEKHPIYGVPALIVVSARPGKFVIPGMKELDCGCIVENMMLAATEEGLGSVFLLAATESLRENAEIMEALNLPEGYTPVGTLGIGYPAGETPVKEAVSRIAVNMVE